jgi:hypothetical protein
MWINLSKIQNKIIENCNNDIDTSDKTMEQLRIINIFVDALLTIYSACLSNNQYYLRDMFVYELRHLHPTHQQSFINNLYAILKKYANSADIDLRNSASIEWCKKATDIEAFFPII